MYRCFCQRCKLYLGRYKVDTSPPPLCPGCNTKIKNELKKLFEVI